MFSAEIIDTWEKFGALEPEWNHLLTESDLDIPLMTFEWFSCWWQSYGAKNTLAVIVVRQGNEAVAIVPLMRTAFAWRGIPVRALTFMANYHSLRTGCVAAREVRGLGSFIFDTLRARMDPFDLLLFDYVPKPSRTAALLEEALGDRRFFHVVYPGARSPYIKVEGTWQSYLQTRQKSLREKVNYMSNVLKRHGTVDIVTYRTCQGQDIERALENMLAISRGTWKYCQNTAIASSLEDTRFYTLLARKAAEKGWLNLWIMSLEGKPAAFVYNLEYKNRVFGLKTGFDDRYRKSAPGKYLDHWTIRESFERGHVEFDMLGKDDPFKMSWTSLFRQHYRYVVFSSTLRGQAAAVMEKTVMPLVRKVMRSNTDA